MDRKDECGKLAAAPDPGEQSAAAEAAALDAAGRRAVDAEDYAAIRALCRTPAETLGVWRD